MRENGWPVLSSKLRFKSVDESRLIADEIRMFTPCLWKMQSQRILQRGESQQFVSAIETNFDGWISLVFASIVAWSEGLKKIKKRCLWFQGLFLDMSRSVARL